MTADELVAYINNIRDQTDRLLAEAILMIANDANAQIKTRIQRTGQDAEGSLYDPYSTTPMLMNCSSTTQKVCQKLAGSKEKRKNLKWVTLKRGNKNIRLFELVGGYKEYRELHGLQTGFVDFTFSGRLWSNIRVVSTNAGGGRAEAVITADNPADYDKLRGNVGRRGQMLEMNPEELQQAQETLETILFSQWNE